MNDNSPLLDKWLADRPYLKDVAGLQQTIDQILQNGPSTQLPPLPWDSLSDDFNNGIPYIKKRELDQAVVKPAAELLVLLARELSSYDIPVEMKQISSLLNDSFQREPELAVSLIRDASAGSDIKPPADGSIPAGALRFLVWRSLEIILRPWVATLSGWMQEAPWGKPYCPLCASKPAMGQLVNTDKGRQKFLSCGCCRSRWGYHRTTCPFCENHDQDKLEIFEIPREESFRIDHCSECNGYVKTYLAEGDEDLFLADWSTLHLDVIAGQQGFERKANSLYEL